MTGSPGPEAIPNLEEFPDEQVSHEQVEAEVIDFQRYVEEHGYDLPEEGASVVQPHQAEPTDSAERARLYAADLKRAEAAREDPDIFEAMTQDYMSLIRGIAGNYFLRGGTGDDLVQEAMFGFYKSVRDYDGQKSSFANFAKLCVRSSKPSERIHAIKMRF